VHTLKSDIAILARMSLAPAGGAFLCLCSATLFNSTAHEAILLRALTNSALRFDH